MPEISKDQRAQIIAGGGELAGIPISEEHAKLAANGSDALYAAFEVVRAIDYQEHEPSNVFHPVVLADGSGEGGGQ